MDLLACNDSAVLRRLPIHAVVGRFSNLFVCSIGQAVETIIYANSPEASSEKTKPADSGKRYLVRGTEKYLPCEKTLMNYVNPHEYPLQVVSDIGIEVSRATARKSAAHIGLGEVKQRRESDSGFEMAGHHDSFSNLCNRTNLQLPACPPGRRFAQFRRFPPRCLHGRMRVCGPVLKSQIKTRPQIRLFLALLPILNLC
jgi:hypothetical protein